MEVSVGVSNRHVHLSCEDYKILFKDMKLEVRNMLKQPEQFASTLTVDIEANGKVIKGLRVLGPNRDYTQVEISRTDSYKLGIEPPVRKSGDLLGAAKIKIIGPYAEIEREACIIANRHIHVNEEIRKEKGLLGVNKVKVKIRGEKPGLIENVYLKDSEKAYFEIHLDTDDANAFLLKNNDKVEIIL